MPATAAPSFAPPLRSGVPWRDHQTLNLVLSTGNKNKGAAAVAALEI